MKFRIAMVGACPFPAPQGSQVLLRDTAATLHTHGHDVCLLVYGHGTGNSDTPFPVYRARSLPGVRKTSAGPHAAKPLLDMLLASALRRLIRERRIDVVHAHNYEALIAALLVGKRPIVYHAHNAMADELPHFWRGSQPLGRWLDRTFPRRADRIIAPQETLADYLAGCGCDRARIAVIPPSVDIHAFFQCAVTEAPAPVLYTGNLDSYQNISLLLKAMELVRQQIPDARLIIGTAEQSEIPGAEAVNVGNFADLTRLLSLDAVVACPRVSWSGYPVKTLNAMAAGHAVVACKSASHPLIHGQTGLAVPDNDACAFAQALTRLITDHQLRATIGNNARNHVAQHMTPTQIAAQIESVYSF